LTSMPSAELEGWICIGIEVGVAVGLGSNRNITIVGLSVGVINGEIVDVGCFGNEVEISNWEVQPTTKIARTISRNLNLVVSKIKYREILF